MSILGRVFPEEESDTERGDQWVEQYQPSQVMDDEGEVA